MSDDEGQVCGCIFLIGTLFGIYEIIKWLVSLYTWEPVAAGIGIIIMTVATMVGYDNMRESLSSHSPSEKGKAFVKFGMIWSISVFIISILVDILYTSVLNKSGERGIGIFLITIFVNMTGTAILFYIGGRELKSCIIEDKKVEGRTITYFGIFWCLFWTILPIALTASKIIVGEGFVSASFLFIAIPGMIVDIIIGKWVSRVDVKKEWEYLSDAQKELNLEKEMLKNLREKIKIEEDNNKKKLEEIWQHQEEIQKQKKDVQKQKKDVQKIKDGVSKEIEEMKKQDKDIQKAREQLETTWKELEETMKSPFRLFLKKKLDKGVFLGEIEELKVARPGDISVINTGADKIISNIKKDLKEQLEIDIVNIEDESYREAFLEYFKNEDGDKAKYDKIRAKYNPTIHVMSDRRNKEWAEKRRFELSKIEKMAKKIIHEKGGGDS